MSFQHQNIVVIIIKAEPADAQFFKRHLLGEFPNLKPFLHWSHTPYHL
jgi:hypothetical protein